MVNSIIDKSRTTNTELEKLAKELRINLNGIYTKDMLTHIIPQKGGYIINMQDSDDGGGTHWIGIYNDIVKQSKTGLKNISLAFDSFGIIPPNEVIDFMSRWSRDGIYSTKQIQNVNFGGCGQYTLHFLRHMQYGKGMPRIKYNRFIRKYV